MCKFDVPMEILIEITENEERIRNSFCRIQGSRKADVIKSPEASIFILA
jgi:hypothetical protein